MRLFDIRVVIADVSPAEQNYFKQSSGNSSSIPEISRFSSM
jgi:hypothetical protein